MSLFNRKMEWPSLESHWRSGVYIELSKETSHWAQIQISDNVRLDRTLSDQGFL
jgi:hypothetical protein